ncbi:MAG: fructose-6-phosphate aldolase [Calditrichaeota bacterium]|nr:fructose-6-phosphate aldolase [Calditrichota bacterium]
MKFFIDTANTDEIKDAVELGIMDGVTTNPSLVAKENRPIEEILLEICELVDGPVSAEVTATDHVKLVEEGLKLADLHDNICVKLPITRDGLKACVELTAEDIPTNMTLCFSPMQALLVAKAGATFVSPFVGRLDDIAQDGMKLIGDIIQMYNNYGFTTEVLVASIRNPIHVYQAAMLGADVATIPLSVIDMLLKHPLTDIGLEKFLADWDKTGQTI